MMFTNKHSICIISGLMVIFWFTPLMTAETRLAFVDFPPYEYRENNIPKGILVDAIKDIFSTIGEPLTLEFLPFKRAFVSVKKGHVDGLFNFYKVPERMPYFDYSEPLIDNELVFFVSTDSKLVYRELKDLDHLRVGVILGYSYGEAFDKSTQFYRMKSYTHTVSFYKLADRQIDIYPCDRYVGLYIVKNEKMSQKIKILPTPLKLMKGHIGFTKGKHNRLIQKLNPVIREMKQNGKLEMYIDKYVK